MSRYLYHPLGLLVITLISLLLFRWTGARVPLPDTRAREQLEIEILELETEIAELERATAGSDSAFEREKVIRNDLLMQKEGEVVLELPENLPQLHSESADGTAAESDEPVWKEWLALIRAQ